MQQDGPPGALFESARSRRHPRGDLAGARMFSRHRANGAFCAFVPSAGAGIIRRWACFEYAGGFVEWAGCAVGYILYAAGISRDACK